MSNRTLQVAGREFMENLRTKTFWVGIFAVPVIIVLALVLAKIFASAKDTRNYAVLDHSEGRLGGEIEREVRSGDMNRITRHFLGNKVESAAQYRNKLQDAGDELAPDSILHGYLEILNSPSDEELDGLLKAGDSSASAAVAKKLKGPMIMWLMEQDQEKLKTAFSGLDQEKYQLVPLAELGDLGDSPEDNEKALNAAINSGRLFAYFVIGDDPVHSFDGCRYVSNNLTDNDLRNWYGQAATRVVRERRIAEAEIEPKTARWIQESLAFVADRVTETGTTEKVERKERANKWAPVGFVYFLWIAVMTATQMLLTNTVEEKSNRIIEVLLSSVSPLQLMAGKIWGIAATGLTIIGSWVIFALIGVAVAPIFVPQLAALPLADMLNDPLYLASFVGYFLGGYLMYAAVLVAIGSVCNSLKEAQNLMQPVIVVLIIPLVAMIPIVQEPNGTIARVLTYVPMFTPFVMMNRAGGPPPAWEYTLTAVLILVTVLVAFWAAGKVFRIGILMTGKPPKVGEILGWLKAPVGTVQVDRERPPST